jgi:hypothetical protein
MKNQNATELTPEQKDALLAEMKAAHTAYTGTVTKVPMGKRVTKSKKHKHIGKYDQETKTYLERFIF